MNENIPIRKKKEEEKRKKRGLFYLSGKRNRKMFLLIVAFLLTIVALSTSTYAWFTSNMTVTVQPIDVQVSSGSGIQISTDAVNWKSMITLADIQAGYSGGVNTVPSGAMAPVSTVKTAYEDASDNSEGLAMYHGTITNDVRTGVMYLNSEKEDDETTLNYIVFDLFLKLDFKETASVQTQQVYFTSGTGITTYGSANTYIQYAGRMGFVVQGTVASSTAVNSMRTLKGHDAVKIYEPNYDVHTANGLANGRDNYQITQYRSDPEDPQSQLVNYVENTNGSVNQPNVPYYGVKAEFEYDEDEDPEDANYVASGVPLNSQRSDYFAPVTPDYLTKANNNSTFEFMALGSGVTKIRVYMWVEGQDIDCENNASGGNVEFNLGFTLVPTASQVSGS